MSKNLKFFLIGFLFSFALGWGINVFQKKLEDFLFLEIVTRKPEFLAAQIFWERELEKLKPIKKKGISEPEIDAKAAISVFVDEKGKERVLFEKNSRETLPIASLTKLMTANVVLEYYESTQAKIAELLYALLIVSDNNAANLLAEFVGQDAFVELMNLEAKKLGLENTHFVNPSGLDPKEPEGQINYSTAEDLAKLAKYITFERPLIWEISTIPEYKNATNTNELLREIPGIVGGKTGETKKAGSCILLVTKAPKDKGYIINVILNSENRSREMKKLIEWVKNAYDW